MNKFLTFAGTQPVYLGDVDFLQNAAGAAFTQLARALMNSGSDSMNAILQGVDITRISNSNVSYSAGIVVINGEILPVVGETIAAEPSDVLYFHVVSALSGERTFKDQSVHQCYDTRSVVINTVSTDGIAVDSVGRLNQSDDDVYIDSNGAGIALSGKLIRKNGFWFVEFNLSAVEGDDPEGHLSFDVSEAHRDMFTSVDFAALAQLYSGGDFSIHQVIVSIVPTSGRTININIAALPGTSMIGSGTNGFLIPLF